METSFRLLLKRLQKRPKRLIYDKVMTDAKQCIKTARIEQLTYIDPNKHIKHTFEQLEGIDTYQHVIGMSQG